jgi:hypothetical protein
VLSVTLCCKPLRIGWSVFDPVNTQTVGSNVIQCVVDSGSGAGAGCGSGSVLAVPLVLTLAPALTLVFQLFTSDKCTDQTHFLRASCVLCWGNRLTNLPISEKLTTHFVRQCCVVRWGKRFSNKTHKTKTFTSDNCTRMMGAVSLATNTNKTFELEHLLWCVH